MAGQGRALPPIRWLFQLYCAYVGKRLGSREPAKPRSPQKPQIGSTAPLCTVWSIFCIPPTHPRAQRPLSNLLSASAHRGPALPPVRWLFQLYCACDGKRLGSWEPAKLSQSGPLLDLPPGHALHGDFKTICLLTLRAWSEVVHTTQLTPPCVAPGIVAGERARGGGGGGQKAVIVRMGTDIPLSPTQLHQYTSVWWHISKKHTQVRGMPTGKPTVWLMGTRERGWYPGFWPKCGAWARQGGVGHARPLSARFCQKHGAAIS